MRNYYHRSHRKDERVKSALKHVPELRINKLEQQNKELLAMLMSSIGLMEYVWKAEEMQELVDRVIVDNSNDTC